MLKFSMICFLSTGLLLLAPLSVSAGSCREAGLCCPGRDTSCVAQKSSANDIFQDIYDRPCYCDHSCMILNDCCHDYKQHCGVIDCEVSEWGAWSECDVDCGTGTMTRQRRIIQTAQNGGKECPELHQKRRCHGQKCETTANNNAKVTREAALILPSKFSNTRLVNETQDIRKNLRLRYPKDPLKESSHEYCVVFEVVRARKGCDALGSEVGRQLSQGSRVCVQCQDAAMRKHLGWRCHGHGVEGKTTRFSSLGSNCHGRWIKREQYKSCPCHRSGHPDFIFV